MQTVEGKLGAIASTENPPLYVETQAQIKYTKPLRETAKQRKRRQKKAKHQAAKLIRGLDGS